VAGLAAGRCGLGGEAEILHVLTPADWGRQGLIAGTPFSLSHTFGQTGPFRPANLPRTTDNVVLAGCGTVPGVGIPTALLSGRLAADRVTGAPITRSRRAVEPERSAPRSKPDAKRVRSQ
jgi:phytoene desaturase